MTVQGTMDTVRRLQLLILEDRLTDVKLLLDELHQSGFEAEWRWVQTKADYLANLHEGLDLLLADYTLPQFTALEALYLLQQRQLDIPFIIVTGSISEEVAVECIKKGAADYLLKDRLTRLEPAVSRALADKKLRDEKRLLEKSLRDSEARFRRLAENAPDVVYRYRVQLPPRFEYINPTVTALTGYEPDDFYADASLIFKIVHPDDRELLLRQISSEEAQTNLVAFRWVHRDGSIIWLEYRHTPVYDESGQLIAVEGIAHDISERKKLEEESLKAELLRVELAKEKELVELKERFVSMVSHEFRTPLTVIRMSSELMSNFADRLSVERKQHLLDEMTAHVIYMTELLDDVLAFSRADAGKLEFDPARLALVAWCQALVEQFQLINKKGQRLILNSTGNFNDVVMDEHLLRHILTNLLSNAVKYSPEGSEISLDLERHESEVVLRVRDSGMGIPLADQERLFEPFHRAKNALKLEGTGLGLAIVKSSVAAHRGTIQCESVEGEGTTFIVRLPATSS